MKNRTPRADFDGKTPEVSECLEDDGVLLTWFDGEGGEAVRAFDGDVRLPASGDGHLGGTTVFPFDVDYGSSADFESVQFAFFPFCRKCRQDVYESLMTLQEHLSDACCSSEVAVDLEWRVCAE